MKNKDWLLKGIVLMKKVEMKKEREKIMEKSYEELILWKENIKFELKK